MHSAMSVIEQAVGLTRWETEKCGIWDQLAPGVWEAYISRFASEKDEELKPEFAVLRLSTERYDEFRKDRKGFFNRYRVFEKDLREQELFAAEPQQSEGKLQYWYLLAIHWPGSSGGCHAYPEEAS